jgi:DNA (cytosine-5)-methyltransferase 1
MNFISRKNYVKFMLNPPSAIDLFCGAGGLSLGFKESGWNIIKSIDSNRTATKTYSENIDPNVECENIDEKTDLPKSTAIIGGPPCQGFSSAGLRQYNDDRNNLVKIFADLIANNLPLCFFFENVEGFLTSDGSRRVFDLLEPLIEAGYFIHFRKINCANYGVPQLRKRVIVIGGLGWKPVFLNPTHYAFGAPGVSNTGKNLPSTPTLHDCLDSLPPPALEPPGYPIDHFISPLSEIDLQRIKNLKPGQTMKDLPSELQHKSFQRRANRRVKDGTPSENRGGAPAGLRRLIYDEPSKAITSNARSEFVHPIEDRFLTIRECARIQTFPDNFIFSGSASEKDVQIGNAIPPLLAQKFASSLISQIPTEPPTGEQGKLLSFILTNSPGMSPALSQLYNQVEANFLIEKKTKQQLLSNWF